MKTICKKNILKYDDDLQDFEENPYTGLLEEGGGGVGLGVGGGGRVPVGEGPYELGMDTLLK